MAAPAELFLHAAGAPGRTIFDLVLHSTLRALTLLLALLLGLFAALFALRYLLLPRCDRRHVTWGCGYTLPNRRMQYTG